MKNILILLLIMILVIPTTLLFGFNDNLDKNEYLRLHIRANSNSESDQEVKYLVKAAVVEFLGKRVNTCTDKEEAFQVIDQNLKQIEAAANNVLKENGKIYQSSASIKNEFFPTRTYNDLVLNEGWYDALIINLGAGEGDNWWCVVYPPLCFVGATPNGTNQVKYKSLLKEIFDNILQ